MPACTPLELSMRRALLPVSAALLAATAQAQSNPVTVSVSGSIQLSPR